MAKKKKKKKLNKAFVFALGGVVLAGGAGVGYYFYAEAKKDPTKYVLAGKRDMEAKNYAQATLDFGTAISKRNSDPSLWIMLGDAFDAQTSLDPENYKKARQSWERALELDATNVEALRRLLTRAQQEVDLMPRPAPQAYTYIRDTAHRLAIADPTDTNAKAAGSIAGVQAAINGAQPDTRKLEEDLSVLRDLQNVDPANADIPFYLCRGMLLKASEAARLGNKQELTKSVAQVDELMSNALQRQPNNAAMYFRAAQVSNFIAIVQQNTPQQAEQAMATATQRAEKALALVDPKTDLYLDAAGYYAKLLARSGEAKKSEEIYRKLMAERPTW